MLVIFNTVCFWNVSSLTEQHNNLLTVNTLDKFVTKTNKSICHVSMFPPLVPAGWKRQ